MDEYDGQPKDGTTSVAIRDQDGMVVLMFPKAVAWAKLDPQTAFNLAEAMARAAHTARFGQPPTTDKGYLHEQIRARVTEELHQLLVTRAALMIHDLTNRNQPPDFIARAVVEAVLAKVT